MKTKLRFTPDAWAKLIWMRDNGTTEIGGFGITDPKDLLLVTDIKTVKQECTSVTVEFDDASVADFFEDMFEAGLEPKNFGRIWIHTHPGKSPTPSSEDENTFNKQFGNCDWAIMFILAKDGNTYARLKYKDPAASIEIKCEVDYSYLYDPAWKEEYKNNIKTKTLVLPAISANIYSPRSVYNRHYAPEPVKRLYAYDRGYDDIVWDDEEQWDDEEEWDNEYYK